MPEARWLIVNADDLGLSAGTNRGIFEAHENGVVTGALFANCPRVELSWPVIPVSIWTSLPIIASSVRRKSAHSVILLSGPSSKAKVWFSALLPISQELQISSPQLCGK